MFDDYKKNVILDYQKKKDANVISINLSHPSPGKLKAECLNVYRERHSQKDEKTLRSFFGSKDNAYDYSQNINKLEIDRFRPLMNFIKGRTTVPDERIVELLAWLIDFEPRPYDSRKNYKEDLEKESAPGGFDSASEKEGEESKISQITSIHKNDEGEIKLREEGEKSNDGIANGKVKIITNELQPAVGRINSFKRTVFKLKIRKVIISFITILVAGSVAYAFLINKNQQCMYWTGDHYQPVACNQKIGDTSIIALDTIKVAHLKKITHPDTLTKNSLGKVWYSKIDGKLEFYTADGFHPIYNDRRLRPITMYILNKYVLPKNKKYALPENRN